MRPRHPGGSMTRAIAQHEGLRKRVRYWIIAVIFVKGFRTDLGQVRGER